MIEPTDEKASTVDTQVEVNIITCKSGKNKVTAVQRDVSHHTLTNTSTPGSLIGAVERTSVKHTDPPPVPISEEKRLQFCNKLG